MGSETPLSGRLEVLRAGVWGTVCNNNFNFGAAQVVCQQLNVTITDPSQILIILNTAVYGQGEGTIWVDDVQCIGNETNLNECFHSPWGSPNSAACIHSSDVSLTCEGMQIPCLVTELSHALLL